MPIFGTIATGDKKGRKGARQAGNAHRERMARRSREATAGVADIGELPDVVDPDRKAACRLDLFRFLPTYFPASTGLKPFSDDHRRVIARIQRCAIEGGRFVNAVYRGFAKALSLDTFLPTPVGWTTMGDVETGDTIFDDRGRPCRVILSTPIMEGRPCYRVTFDDRESVVCSEDHLWSVFDGYLRRHVTITTTALVEGIEHNRAIHSCRKNRYSVAVAKSLKIEDENTEPLIIPAYVLGSWLGDGHSASNRITIGDLDADEMITNLESCGETVEARPTTRNGNAQGYIIGRGRRHRTPAIIRAVELIGDGRTARDVANLTGITYRAACGIKYLGRNCSARKESLLSRLRRIGVVNNKHIPACYLRRPESDRWALLQGLMDTDGTISKQGHCSFSNKRKILVDGIRELIASLGIKSTLCSQSINGRTYWNVHFTTYAENSCFRLQRKSSRLRRRRRVSLCSSRRIISVEPIDGVPVRCIQVDSPSQLYLCGRAMIPTHNTTISENTVIWATLYGHRRFVPVFSAEADAAGEIIDSIKREIEENDLLAEDFPEVCHAVRSLEGKPQRCGSQTYLGERTHIEWTADTIVLPTIPGSPASGAIIRAKGLTAASRGMKFKRADGTQQRPDFVVIDDPQTDESASTDHQVAKRLRIIAKSILRLAGHATGLAVVLNGTVIQPDDLIERLLDHKKNPAWQGERLPMVRKWSKAHEKHWLAEYARLRNSYDPDDIHGQERAHKAANAYYRDHRKIMDAGANVSWEHCYDEAHELSAIQHAYNVLIDDGEDVFASEYQNQPLVPDTDQNVLTADQVAAKFSGRKRGEIPTACDKLTMFVDIHDKLLYWLVAAWQSDFTGHIVDYGTYPDQKRAYFTMRQSRRTLGRRYQGVSVEEAKHRGIEDLVNDYLAREWKRDDGAIMRIDRCLIDRGDDPHIIESVCRRLRLAAVMPSLGVGITAAKKPFSEYRRQPGQQVGHHWRIPSVRGTREMRYVAIDTNYWKTFSHTRLATGPGTPGNLAIFGADARANQLLADHLVAETFEPTSGRGRVVNAWFCPPGRDNHWFDCLVGCCCAASMEGISLGDEAVKVRSAKRKRVKLSDLQRSR